MKINLTILAIMLVSCLGYGQGLKENTSKTSAKGSMGIGIDFGYSGSLNSAYERNFYPSVRFSYNIVNGLSLGSRLFGEFSSIRTPLYVINARTTGASVLVRYQPFRKVGVFVEPDYGIGHFRWSEGSSGGFRNFHTVGLTTGYQFMFNKLPQVGFEIKVRFSKTVPFDNNHNVYYTIISHQLIGIRYNFGKPFKEGT